MVDVSTSAKARDLPELVCLTRQRLALRFSVCGSRGAPIWMTRWAPSESEWAGTDPARNYVTSASTAGRVLAYSACTTLALSASTRMRLSLGPATREEEAKIAVLPLGTRTEERKF